MMIITIFCLVWRKRHRKSLWIWCGGWSQEDDFKKKGCYKDYNDQKVNDDVQEEVFKMTNEVTEKVQIEDVLVGTGDVL